MPTLSWIPKDGEKVVYNITKSITTLGSDRGNDVILLGMEAASHHGIIVFDGRDFSIAETESKAPIFINGKKRRKTRLSDNDRLTLGAAEINFSIFAPTAVKRSDSPNASGGIDGLRQLQGFSDKLMHRQSVPDLLEELMDSIIDLTGAAKGFLVLFENGSPSIKVARNVHRENLDSSVAKLSDSIVAKVVETKKAIIVSDAQNDTHFSNSESVINLRLNSVMCVPLIERSKLLGLIYVGNNSITGLFEASTMEVLNIFAAQAALLIQNALLVDDLKLKNTSLSNELKNQNFGEIIGSSKSMQAVFRKVEKVATTEVSVLISGETGTGKELIAKEIHRHSPRRNGPFITVNCGAIPETLMESEFFGYTKGAFTGANATRQGKFQAADKGTIFLDEIGEMPLSLQVKILRVLQERQVVKVGATKQETLDIRVVAATNRDLEEEVKQNRFREDLFYRLNVIHIDLPALRERDDDIVLLAKFLLKRYTNELGSKVKGFTPGAVIAIRKHNWPGNVREMENRIKKAIILCDGTMIGPKDIDLEESTLPKVQSLAEAREDFQRRYILDTLAKNNGNRTKTAEDLGVDPRTIYRYLEKA